MLTSCHLPELNCSLFAGQLARASLKPEPSETSAGCCANELDALVIFCFSDATSLENTEFACLTANPAWADFKGGAGEVAVLYMANPASSAKQCPAKRVLVAGLGEAGKFSMPTLRLAAATALRRCSQLKLASVGFWAGQFDELAKAAAAAPEFYGQGFYSEAFNPEFCHKNAARQLLQEALLAATCSLYTYERYITKRDKSGEEVKEIVLLADSEESLTACQSIAAHVLAVAAGVALAKDLTNGPSNIITPAAMQAVASDLAQRLGFKFSVLQNAELARMGMGAYAAVCQGSAQGGRLLVLEYTPKGQQKEDPLVFVGKGLTFDSGGISLKPSAGMEEMKSDMAGAAAVLGMCEALGRLAKTGLPELMPARRVVALLACAENMPDGAAMRPGDIVTALNGKTIEIVNTDAEGRLVLCDTIAYAQEEYSPAGIVDIATLTGACRVALGSQVGGIFSNNPKWLQSALAAGLATGENVWPLPLWDTYFDNLKSSVADMRNVGAREGGAINAALFLKEFIKDGLPWIHLDIAGPAYIEKGNALCAGGATAFGLRLLLNLALRSPV